MTKAAAPRNRTRSSSVAIAATGDTDFVVGGRTRKPAEAALSAAQPYAGAIVNALRDPLAVLDGELRVRAINDSFSRLFRVSAPEILGRSLDAIDGDLWRDAALNARLNDVVATATAFADLEMVYQSEVRGPRSLLLSASTLPGDDDARGLILLVIDDVTERQRIEKVSRERDSSRREEERLHRRRLELTDALRVSTVGELATGLSHEINQPLAAISSLVEACSQYVRSGDADSTKLLALLEDTGKQCMRAAEIVAHLRSFVSKGEATFHAVDLHEIVTNVPRLMLADLERTRIDLSMDESAEPLPVRADKVQLEQVVVNLIQNAMDSIHEADREQRLIELSTRVVKNMGEVRIRDTGTGLPQSAAEKMFTPFFTTKARGLGMGLALSRSIIEAHRGRIWTEAPANGMPGVVVVFAIPLKRPRRRRTETTK